MNIPTMTPPVTASGAITPLEIVVGCVDTGAPATVEAFEPWLVAVEELDKEVAGMIFGVNPFERQKKGLMGQTYAGEERKRGWTLGGNSGA